MKHSYEYWNDTKLSLCWAYKGHPPDRYANTFSAPPGAHTIWWIVGKPSTLELGGETLIAKPGSCLFSPSGFGRQQHAGRLLSIRFEARYPERAAVFHQKKPAILPTSSIPRLTELAQSLQQQVSKEVGKGFKHLRYRQEKIEGHGYLDIQSALLSFVQEWIKVLGDTLSMEAPAPPDPRIERILHAVHSWPLQLMPDRTSIARESGISVSQMNRIFSRHFGATPLEILDRRRLDWAVLHVAEQDMLIKEAALSLGFRYSSQFTSWFRRHTGMSPQEYRTACED